jgi:peptidylprolyl isomerase
VARRPTPLRTLLAVVVAGALVGCSPTGDAPMDVEVSGEPGTAPELTFPTPLDVGVQRVEVLVEGTGPKLVEGQPVLLDFFAESATDGSVIAQTYDSEPRAYILSQDSLGPDLHAALRDERVGARILQIAPGRGDTPAAVAVYDVLSTRAVGDPVEPREGMPTVTLSSNGEPTVTIPDADPPSDLVVQPLIRGLGPQVSAGSVVTVQYVGVTWSDGEVFDSTWADGKLPANLPIGVGSVPEGWDEGIVEQTVGSQVLLVLPPDSGVGGDDALAGQPLVFVVDILAATAGPEGS